MLGYNTFVLSDNPESLKRISEDAVGDPSVSIIIMYDSYFQAYCVHFSSDDYPYSQEKIEKLLGYKLPSDCWVDWNQYL